jgi:catechol 2,3-dioxygenase-like lactoylglutathione lyase family enzyme
MTEPVATRIQLALNVTDLEQAVAFYTRLLGTEPAKRRPGYANFAVVEPPLKLVLLENADATERLNHLGIEVGSTAEVAAATERLDDAGVATDVEASVTCCFAEQDKVWVTAPDGERWEVYTVLADSPTFYAVDDAPGCCAPSPTTTPQPATAGAPSC